MRTAIRTATGSQLAVGSGSRQKQSEAVHHHEHGHPHVHSHDHDQSHEHSHSHNDSALTATAHSRTIELEKEILSKNQFIAERNRGWFAGKGILALNLVSSPGSGKTSLLERTVVDLKNEFEIGVIEGDQETIHDAERIRATGCKAVQINTGTGCHLESRHARARIKITQSGGQFPSIHRKRRQSRLPGDVRSRRTCQSRNPFGYRGRGQTAKIPAYVPRKQADDPQQDRPASLCQIRC